MTRINLLLAAVLVVAMGTALANPSGTNIVINEIYCDGAGYYDGSEFIELYNPTASPITINGWVLTGVEYDETCGGEDLWQFPLTPTISIPAGGYLVVAKDGDESAYPSDDDSFYWEFGFYPDFEQYDSELNPVSFEHDSPYVPNMVLLTDDPSTIYSDEIQLVGGRGYGVICSAPTSDSDVVYLYDGDPSSGPANLVDLVEYIDPAQCAADPCTGIWQDDGADDNAWPGIPFLGNTIGRNAVGTDTDMSINDWTLQAPTPRAENVPNTPPWISTLRYAPIPPNDADDTLISAFVTDDGVIDSVMVYYRVEGGPWSKVPATADGDVYTAHIPPQTNLDVTDYFMRAVDNLGAVMNYPSEAFSDPYSYSTGITPIYNVQYPAGPSPLVGQPVNVRGIVTMASGLMSDNIFYIHDATGEFHGIACYMGGTPTPVQEGDLVTFCGYVSEYYEMTEVNRHFLGSMVIESSGNTDYGYTDVTTAQITFNNENSEGYEGQLIRVHNATVTYESDVYGIWYCRDSSGIDCKVDDEAYYSYDAEVLDVLAELRGVLIYDFNEYKVQPRYDADIIGPPRIDDVRYSPVPPSNASPTTISAVLQDNTGISSATLHWSYTKARPYPNTVPMTASKYEHTWTAQIPAQSNGTRVYYYVDCTDGTMDAEKPTVGGYSYYTGTTTIQSVQQVPVGGDASPMDTLAVNVKGYVTAEPGIFNANTFYIQEDVGGWHGIMVYDRTGTVSFQRGDYVVCCGEVDEYFGQTQIALHFADAAQLTAKRGDEIAPVSIPTGILQSYLSAEEYESVFVIAEDATVYDDDLGFGEWAISNATAADTCRVDDYADYDYVPLNGDNVYVRGIVAYAFGLFRIEPRGNEDIAVNPVGVSDDQFGGKFGLAQNTPNPFNPKTTIAFNLPQGGDVTLEIYDVAGRKVATLLKGSVEAGPHTVSWDGATDTGDHAASGVYFYKLTAGDQKTSRKMVLLK
ncbi:MAG: lamin tail domain-containing protein [Candidatus Eisenbacteria bacterium]|nr:lamin tail domain-containing protein [Candidatus Eisenbacteria bacterium]